MTRANTPNPDDIPAPRALSRLIGTVSREWRRQMNLRLKPFGLNLSMRQVLMQLQRHPKGLMQRDLADLLGIEAPTLVRLLDLLEQKGWIQRLPSPHDKRCKYSVMTAKAAEQIRIIEKQSEELRVRMLEGLSEQEIKAGRELMRRIHDNLRAP